MKEEIWMPRTPSGIGLMHLCDMTESGAWSNLLYVIMHMPYKTVEDLKKRGYTVEKIN